MENQPNEAVFSQYKQFVQFIAGEDATPNEGSALSHLYKIASIAVEGGFSGSVYLQWGCGSWMKEAISSYIQQCEEISNQSFSSIIEELIMNDINKARVVVNSYLSIPLPSYKNKSAIPPSKYGVGISRSIFTDETEVDFKSVYPKKA